MQGHETKPELPTHPNDRSSPREVENPGDPGPSVLVPPQEPQIPAPQPAPFTTGDER